MPKKNETLVACVLDRSGSMQSIIDDAIGGFNTMLNEQKNCDVGTCKMTVALFDDQYEIWKNNADVKDVEEITSQVYKPRGMTALYDAICKTINTVGEDLDKMEEDEKPERVLFVILTDGFENSSKEFTLEDAKKLIQQQRDEWKWEFLFLAADENALQDGTKMGIVHTHAYDTNQTQNTYSNISRQVVGYRCGSNINY
jgi:uncharacterized protein YegL